MNSYSTHCKVTLECSINEKKLENKIIHPDTSDQCGFLYRITVGIKSKSHDKKRKSKMKQRQRRGTIVFFELKIIE